MCLLSDPWMAHCCGHHEAASRAYLDRIVGGPRGVEGQHRGYATDGAAWCGQFYSTSLVRSRDSAPMMRDSADVPARHQKMPSEHTTPMLQRSQAYRMVPDILPSKAGQAAAQQPRGGGEGAGQCNALLTRVSSPSQTCIAAAKHNHESK